MSIADLLKLTDDKLHDIFHAKTPDHSKLRKAAIKRIDTALDQFAKPEPTNGKKMWKVANDVVHLTLPFEVSGKSEFFIPTNHFTTFLTKLKGLIEAGDLDKEISGEAAPKATSGAPKVKRAGWSPERRAAFEAAKKK